MDYARIAPVMGNLWSPIAAVTSFWEDKPNVQIAVAIAGASIVPTKPRIVIQIYKRNFSHDQIYRSGAFALNFLRTDQLQLIAEFGLLSGRYIDKLAGKTFELKASGSPVLRDCWGFLDCRIINAMDGGDMTCFLADVIEGDTYGEGGPLWWRDARRRLPAQVMAEWERKISGEIEYSTSRMDQIDHATWQDGVPPS